MKKRTAARLLAAAAAFSGVIIAQADTITVPGDYPTIAGAVDAAYSGDRIVVENSNIFNSEPSIDWMNKAIRVESLGNIVQSDIGVYRMSNGGVLATTAQYDIQLEGELCSPEYGTAYVQCDYLNMGYDSILIVRTDGALHLSASRIDSFGYMGIQANATFTAAIDPGYTLKNDNDFSMANDSHLDVTGSLSVRRMTAAEGAVVNTGGGMSVYETLITNGADITTSRNFYVSIYVDVYLYDSDLTAVQECGNSGELMMWDGMLMTGELENNNVMQLFGTTVTADRFFNGNDYGDEALGWGIWLTDVDNIGLLGILDDTTIFGDVENTGEIRVYEGTLTIRGDLVNNGTIIGDVSREAGTLGGGSRLMHVADNVSAGYTGQIHLPSAEWELRVDGDYEIGITDNDGYDMRYATLRLGALAGSTIECEVMSRDVGPIPYGLDRNVEGHYPIGTLHIAGADVTLVDEYDNDNAGFESPEVIYVDTLQIDPGATLHNDAHVIYYGSLINQGTVTTPDNLVPIGSTRPGDLDGDLDVDLSDLAVLLGRYGTCAGDAEYDPLADFDHDGCIGLSDLAFLLAHYGIE